jgi:large subunit ribosomal protein L10
MPSNKILEQKKAQVAELAEAIKNSAGGVLVNYQGITVEDDTKMRKELREAGVKYVVVKNTMTGRACEMNGMDDMKPYLNGMTALAIGAEDPIAPAKVLKKYADKLETFSILAGYLDGAVIDEKTVNALADIPSKETLIAKFLGSIRSPLYGLAYALQAVVDKGDSASAEEAAPAEEAPAAEEAAPATEEAAPAEA